MKFLGILEFLNLRIPRFRISRNSRILIFSFKRIKNELFLQKKVFA